MKNSLVLSISMLLVACGMFGDRDGAPSGAMLKSHQEIMAIPDAVPRVERRSKYGNPASYKVFGKQYSVMDSAKGYRKKGVASWYGTKFHGRRTSSGEPYDMYAMTAAHKSLPLPTYVQVTNLKNKRSVVLKVNDRGPFHDNRLIDLSYAAAVKLGITAQGTGLVEVVAINPRQDRQRAMRKVSYKTVTNGSELKAGADKIKLFVQVGAFSNRDNALDLQNRLLDSQINNVQINRINGAAQPMFRVRVGPVNSVEKADRIADRISRLGIGNSDIIVE